MITKMIIQAEERRGYMVYDIKSDMYDYYSYGVHLSSRRGLEE